MTPSVPEVVDFFVRLEDDPQRRGILNGVPFQIFEAAATDGLFDRLDQDAFARLVGTAVQRGLIAFEQTHAIAPAVGAIWSDLDFQARSGYFVTIAGRQMVDLFRRQADPPPSPGGEAPDDPKADLRDCFICHASEDKAAVALPLADALISTGWTVWLDQLDLTLGDSLNSRIEAALAHARFGVVILSRAFFAKEWTQRELGALASREIDAKTKVILPIWYGVDHHYIVARSPVLADRLGVSTDVGIEKVASEVSRAIEKASEQGDDAGEREAPAPEVEQEGSELLSIPTDMEERRRLVAEGAEWWEYRLFAGRLMEGLVGLEGKWQDHELRLPAGPRSGLGADPVAGFLSRETGWMRRQIATLDRIFAPAVLEEAFGVPGEAGDPERIEAAARRLIALYESLLDWAARVRNTDVGGQEEEVIELAAQLVDRPLHEIRDFIRSCADQIARLEILSKPGTEQNPVEIRLTLELTIDQQIQDQIIVALERAT